MLAAFSGTAQAAPKKHPDSDAIAMRVLQSNSSGAVFTGTAKDKILGSGLVIVKANQHRELGDRHVRGDRLLQDGHDLGKGDRDDCDSLGRQRVRLRRAVTGGTGKVKGAKGSLKIVGSATAADPTYQTYKLTGALTY